MPVINGFAWKDGPMGYGRREGVAPKVGRVQVRRDSIRARTTTPFLHAIMVMLFNGSTGNQNGTALSAVPGV